MTEISEFADDITFKATSKAGLTAKERLALREEMLSLKRRKAELDVELGGVRDRMIMIWWRFSLSNKQIAVRLCNFEPSTSVGFQECVRKQSILIASWIRSHNLTPNTSKHEEDSNAV